MENEKRICVFDTETTSLQKPFCYNIGYQILTEDGTLLLEREYCIKQVWYNLELFTTAYYAEKRPIYVGKLRSRQIQLETFARAMRQIRKDFETYNVTSAYAYNSPFDESVMEFNCDWFTVVNPFEIVPVFDIRTYVMNSLIDTDYKEFCDEHGFYTETKAGYSTSAETVYSYLTNNKDYIEEHTALADSRIESEILFKCLEKGLKLDTVYPCPITVPRDIKRTVKIEYNNELLLETEYDYIRISKNRDSIKIKNNNS